MVLLVVKASMWPKYMWGEIIDSVYIYIYMYVTLITGFMILGLKQDYYEVKIGHHGSTYLVGTRNISLCSLLTLVEFCLKVGIGVLHGRGIRELSKASDYLHLSI